MSRKTLGVVAALAAMLPAAGAAQTEVPPRSAIYIMDREVDEVLKGAPPAVDQQLRVVDMGEYQLAVGIVHRGPTVRPGAAPAAPSAAAGGAAAAQQPACGTTGTAPSGIRGLFHDATTETYIITSGGGTLITGGRIVNGRRSAPESDVTRVLNGPSCSGNIEGDFEQRVVTVGDIIIIPAGVPHGWTDIADHVDYVSVRPDPDEVLDKGYVHPTIRRMMGGGR